MRKKISFLTHWASLRSHGERISFGIIILMAFVVLLSYGIVEPSGCGGNVDDERLNNSNSENNRQTSDNEKEDDEINYQMESESVFKNINLNSKKLPKGPYSGVSINNITETPIIHEEVYYSKIGTELLDISSSANFEAPTDSIIVTTSTSINFNIALKAGRYVLAIETLGANSISGYCRYTATVNGNTIGHHEYSAAYRIYKSDFIKAMEFFYIKDTGTSSFSITLGTCNASKIRSIKIYKQIVGLNHPLPVMKKERLSEISGEEHPRLLLNKNRITAIRNTYQDSNSNLHKFYALPSNLWSAETATSSHFVFLPDRALAYLLNSDSEYLDKIRDWLWRSKDFSVEEIGYDNNPGGSFLKALSLTYDWLYDELPNDLREAVRERIKDQIRYIYDYSLINRGGASTVGEILSFKNDHWSSPLLAMLLAAIAVYNEDDSECKQWLYWSYDRLERIVLASSEDGSFAEGPDYFDTSTEYPYDAIDLYEYYTGKYIKGTNEMVRRSSEYRLNHLYPNMQKTIAFGDTSVNSSRPFIWSLLLEAKRFKDAKLMGVAEYIASFGDNPHNGYRGRYMTALAFDESLNIEPFKPSKHLSYFSKDSGTAIVRSSWNSDGTVLAFSSKPFGGHKFAEIADRHGAYLLYSTGHQHPDQNHFVVYGRGEVLIEDPGYTYEKNTYDENTILVDGIGQLGDGEMWPAPNSGRAYIKNFVRKGDVSIMTGSAASTYPANLDLTKFERTLVMAGKDLIVVYDDIASEKLHEYSSLLHTWGDITERNGIFTISKNNAKMTLSPINITGFQALTSSYKPEYRDSAAYYLPENQNINLIEFKSTLTQDAKFLIPMVISSQNEEISAIEDYSYLEKDYYSSRAIKYENVVVAFNQRGKGEQMKFKLSNGKLIKTKARTAVGTVLKNNKYKLIESF